MFSPLDATNRPSEAILYPPPPSHPSLLRLTVPADTLISDELDEDMQAVMANPGASTLKRFIWKHAPNVAIFLGISAVVGTTLGILFDQHVLNADTSRVFRHFWSDHYGIVLEALGLGILATITAIMAAKLSMKQKDERRMRDWAKMLVPTILLVGLLIGTLYHQGVLHGTKDALTITEFTALGTAGLLSVLLAHRIHKRGFDGGDIALTAALVAGVVVGLWMGGQLNSQLPDKFINFWKAEYVPFLATGAIALGTLGIIGFYNQCLQDPNTKYTRAAYIIVFLAAAIYAIGFMQINGTHNYTRLLDLATAHTWGALLGMTTASLLSTLLYKKLTEKVIVASAPPSQPAQTFYLNEAEYQRSRPNNATEAGMTSTNASHLVETPRSHPAPRRPLPPPPPPSNNSGTFISTPIALPASPPQPRRGILKPKRGHKREEGDIPRSPGGRDKKTNLNEKQRDPNTEDAPLSPDSARIRRAIIANAIDNQH